METNKQKIKDHTEACLAFAQFLEKDHRYGEVRDVAALLRAINSSDDTIVWTRVFDWVLEKQADFPEYHLSGPERRRIADIALRNIALGTGPSIEFLHRLFDECPPEVDFDDHACQILAEPITLETGQSKALPPAETEQPLSDRETQPTAG